MSESSSEFSRLLNRAVAGEAEAINRLLSGHRQRLTSMVRVHMDHRLASRLDASDVVQDALLAAAQRLKHFPTGTVPFYVWLRQIARDRLSELYRRHVKTKKRSVLREQAWGLSQDSVNRLAAHFDPAHDVVVNQVIQEERRQRLCQALSEMPQQHREILVMRHLEQMSISEIASASKLTEGAVKMRQLRAVQGLRSLLDRASSSSSS